MKTFFSHFILGFTKTIDINNNINIYRHKATRNNNIASAWKNVGSALQARLSEELTFEQTKYTKKIK